MIAHALTPPNGLRPPTSPTRGKIHCCSASWRAIRYTVCCQAISHNDYSINHSTRYERHCATKRVYRQVVTRRSGRCRLWLMRSRFVIDVKHCTGPSRFRPQWRSGPPDGSTICEIVLLRVDDGLQGRPAVSYSRPLAGFRVGFYRVARFDRTGWPTSVGIGRRITPGSRWPRCAGLRNQSLHRLKVAVSNSSACPPKL
jgi:hypothetical protein